MHDTSDTEANRINGNGSRHTLERKNIPAIADNDFVYLNSGGSGPTPDYVRAGMKSTDDLCSGPAYLEGAKFYARCAETVASAKSALARLLGGSPEDYALSTNTSNGMSLGVAAIDWREGDEVITTTTEHPGCLVPLHAAMRRHGIVLKFVEPTVTTEKVEAAMTDRTRLIALSHVDWTNGYVLPLEEITALARERGVFTLVDGAQSVGDMRTDIPATGADMYAFTGHKWLLGPEGAGAFYVRPDCDLSSTNLGGASIEDMASFDISGDYELKTGAGRFEASTTSPALAGGLAAAANEMADRGDEGFSEILRKAELLMDLLAEDPKVTLRSPRPAKTGLVSFEVEGIKATDAVERLLERHFVLRYLPEPTHYIRASTHLFVTDDELRSLARAVSEL